MTRRTLAALALLVVLAGGTQAQPRPPAREVLLRLDAGGPVGLVTALEFSPKGEKLYTAGYDKLVRVWAFDDTKSPPWVVEKIYRVPVGPGLAGAINALAVSPDGQWLAVGGLGIVRGATEDRGGGIIVPRPVMSREMLQDEGVIYAFDLGSGAVKTLRGHLGAVTNLAFAPALDGKDPLLVSAAYQEENDPDRRVGQLRLWDLRAGKSVAERTVPSKSAATRPGLAIRHTGKGPEQVVIASAWYDGKLRLWDVARSEVHAFQDGIYNRTVASHAGRRAFVTTSLRDVNGRVSEWTLPGDLPGKTEVGTLATFSPNDRQTGPFFLPQALSLLPIAGKARDGAAVILRRQGVTPAADDTEELALLNLETGAEVGKRLSLGKVTGELRLLAASANGRFLAVADGSNNRVVVYTVEEVLAGRTPGHELRGLGMTFRRAAFVVKGADRGLALNEFGAAVGAPPREPGAGDLIFDFSGRKLSADRKDWKLDTPDASEWKVRYGPAPRDDPDPRPFVAVRRGAEKERVIRLGSGSEVTAYAVAPNGAGLKVPVIAVASLDQYRQPLLVLYRADSGARLRHFTGHVSAVRSLAFSAGGRLLLSAAEDQTVSVWTLTSLPGLLKQGRVPGLAVQMNGAKLEVAAAADGALRKGDVIDGVVEGADLLPFKSVIDFYETVFKVEPDKKVTLRVGGKDVALDVVQGIDERKPLLTLFVKKAEKPDDMLWIGWHPSGAYEVSAAAAEDYLGWHYNTGKEDGPTTFASSDQYRKDHQKKGILRDLVRTGSLAEALKDRPDPDRGLKPNPRLDLVAVTPDGPGVVQRFLRQRDVTLRLTFNPDFPADQIESVRWQVRREGETFDRVAVRALKPSADGEWTADLSKLEDLAWRRGVYEFQAVVRTREDDKPGPSVSTRLGVQYLPQAPVIEYTPAFLAKHFGGAERARLVIPDNTAPLHLQAAVTPDSPDQKVLVRYRREGEPFVELKDGSRLDAKIDLQPGRNVIEIEAENAGAEGTLKSLETTRKTLEVFRAGPPQLVLRTVTELKPGGRQEEVLPGQTIRVAFRKVRIQGLIKADEVLEEARLKQGNKDPRDLASFKREKEIAIDETLELDPGGLTVAFSARTANSPRGVVPVVLRLNYVPPLPHVFIETPAENAVLTVNPTALRARLVPDRDDPRPFAVAVLVDGRVQAKPEINERDGTLTAALRLEPGLNPKRVEVRVSNEWGADEQEARPVTYRRPPRIVKIDSPAVGAKPFLDYTATVESASDLRPTALTIDDRTWPADAVLVEKDNSGAGLWRVVARDVNLRPGANVFRVRVGNAEESSPEHLTDNRTYLPPPLPDVPVVRFLAPQEDGGVVEAPDYPVRFEVTSAVPFRRVRLLRGGEELFLVDVKKVDKNAAGAYVVRAAAPVRLQRGDNVFGVEAENEGGLNKPAFAAVHFQYHPVRILIDRFQSLEADGKDYPPLDQLDREGRVVFDRVTPGRVRLHGRVVWGDAEDQQMRAALRLRIFVNGFQQVPVFLSDAPHGVNERKFEVDALLNREVDNVLQIDMPDVPVAGGRRQCVVRNCARPVRGLRLHLLVVGIGEQDGKQLVEQARKALRVESDPKNPEKSSAPPAFDEVILYGPLAGYVRRGDVFRELDSINARIKYGGTRAGEPRNDLVMMYYQGEERITKGGHFFLTDESKYLAPEHSSIDLDRMVQVLSRTRGAQLMLLDVAQAEAARTPTDDRIVQWPKDGRIGVLRLARDGTKPLPPNSSRLLPILEEKWSLAVNLGSLEKEMTDAFQRLKDKGEPLKFVLFLPPELRGVIAGLKPKS